MNINTLFKQINVIYKTWKHQNSYNDTRNYCEYCYNGISNNDIIPEMDEPYKGVLDCSNVYNVDFNYYKNFPNPDSLTFLRFFYCCNKDDFTPEMEIFYNNNNYCQCEYNC